MPIIKSIYWEQTDREQLVYKFPFNNVTMGSVLTVNDSQEAFFFKSGTLCDSFTSGRHVLSSANLPVLQKLINLPSGGDTTFTAEIWFISKLEKRNMLWGIGGLRIVDPYFQIPLKLSSRGQYGFRISDGGLFLKKLIGTIGFANTDLLEDQFRTDVIEAVRVTIAKFMKENDVNVNELGSEYKALSKAISKNLQLSFDEYGIELLNFNIEDISFDENDKGYQTVMEGIAEQAKLNKLGVNYLQQKQIDIAQTAAGNEGAGNFMGIGMGLGMGNSVGGMVGNAIRQSGIGTPPPPPPVSSYYVAKDRQTTGPFQMQQIQEMMLNREVSDQTYVYKLGGTQWVLVRDEPELSRLYTGLVPPPPPVV